MKKIIILNIFTILFCLISHAQEQLSKREQADLLYNRYEYNNASKLYLSLADKAKPSIEVLERLAMSYRKLNNYEAAEKYYAKAVAHPQVSPMSYFYYAEILLTNEKFEQAKAAYKKYEEVGKTANDDKQLAASLIAVKIASCDSAAVWKKQSSSYTIQNAKNLNTPYEDWGLSYLAKDGLVFTSARPTDSLIKFSEIYKRNGNPWLKIFQTSDQQSTIVELPIIVKQYSSFASDYHVGPMITNSTGDTAYVTITTRIYASEIPLDKKETKNAERLYTRRLQLIMVTKVDGRWQNTQSFPYNDVKAYSLGNAALSKNGQMLYFTSDMPGGFGETDIWYSEKMSDGTWSKPVNCGSTINTSAEEGFPTIGANGELFYASKGKIGFGGYDIYVSKGQKTNWTPSENLKYPINTSYDDFYFSTIDGVSGFLSSNRKGGLGSDDIYSFVYNAPKLPEPVVKNPITYEAGKIYVLKNVYYDFDQSNIRTDAAQELDKLVAILKEYPAMHIELGSHTDSRGNDDYNQCLSQARANSAVAYLIARGISANRLSGKGYGESQLLNKCANGVDCSDEEHQANRRTEFKVVKE